MMPSPIFQSSCAASNLQARRILPWQLLEHLRIAQWDILDFSRNPDYEEMKWPDDYWPKTEAPPDAAAWDKSIEQFRRDLKAIEELVSDAAYGSHRAHPARYRTDASA